MKVEFTKSVAIYNTYKTIYVVSLDNGDLIPIEQIEYVDDTCLWQINEWYFRTEEVFAIKEIVESFVKKYEDNNESTIVWYHP
jgi:hypothetical protein